MRGPPPPGLDFEHHCQGRPGGRRVTVPRALPQALTVAASGPWSRLPAPRPPHPLRWPPGAAPRGQGPAASARCGGPVFPAPSLPLAGPSPWLAPSAPCALSGLPLCLASPFPPLCLKFWRDPSTNGEVSPLGHRSALIRFGKARSLPPSTRPQPGPIAPERVRKR